MDDADTGARRRRAIRASDLRGLPGLRRSAALAILTQQPGTVREAIALRDVGRRTARWLFDAGLLPDPDGALPRSPRPTGTTGRREQVGPAARSTRGAPAKNHRGQPDGPPRIRLGEVFLDEVRTRVHDGSEVVVAYRSLPAKRHALRVDGEALVLHTLPLTALQLYCDGVLPGDPVRGVEVGVGGRTLGRFIVDSMRCVDALRHEQGVLLRLRRVEAPST